MGPLYRQAIFALALVTYIPAASMTLVHALR